jgi:hypothetical protein
MGTMPSHFRRFQRSPAEPAMGAGCDAARGARNGGQRSQGERRRVIVELGPRISTVYLARLLSNEGGHIYAVEDDERWATLVDEWLDREGTADRVS